MTEQKLKLMVAYAIALDREISDKQDALTEIKKTLIEEARGRSEEYTPTEGGGSSWITQDNIGNLARVTFPAPTLKDRINGIGKTVEKLMQVAGKDFPILFPQIPAYRPCEDFRSQAELRLGKNAGKLIKLVTNESAPRVSFETKEVQE